MEHNEQYNLEKLHNKRQEMHPGDVIKMDDIHAENRMLLIINPIDISKGYMRSLDRGANKNYTVAECISEDNQFVRVTIGNIKYDGVYFVKHVDLSKYIGEIFHGDESNSTEQNIDPRILNYPKYDIDDDLINSTIQKCESSLGLLNKTEHPTIKTIYDHTIRAVLCSSSVLKFEKYYPRLRAIKSSDVQIECRIGIFQNNFERMKSRENRGEISKMVRSCLIDVFDSTKRMLTDAQITCKGWKYYDDPIMSTDVDNVIDKFEQLVLVLNSI